MLSASFILLLHNGIFSALATPLSDENLFRNFAVVIDAGSSGSRAYLYQWPDHSGDPKSLLQIEPLRGLDDEPLVKSISPGLSSLADEPSNAGLYIEPLLDFAAENIPAVKHQDTHLFILATAGMRLLSEAKQRAILSQLRDSISKKYNFIFPDTNIEVISGNDEGIYQWLSINYVLGKFDPMVEASEGPRTVGALDMGGASLQIAMEVYPEDSIGNLSKQDQTFIDEVNLGAGPYDSSHRYKVFVTTFLGFGANEALARHRRSLVIAWLHSLKSKRKVENFSHDWQLEDPCLPKGLTENVSIKLDAGQLLEDLGDKLTTVLNPDQTVYVSGTGDWNECYIELSKFTRAREIYLKSCDTGSDGCLDPGMRHPPIDFDKSDFYGFSEFWYTSQDVLDLGGSYDFDKFRGASKNFCRENWSQIYQNYQNGHYPLADLERLKTQCFKSAWVAVALHQGLAFPESYKRLTSAPNSISGRIINWTLGALLYRTRHLPKIAIEASLKDQMRAQTYINAFVENSHAVVLLTIVTLIILVIVYIRRLRRFVQPSATAIRKVPSLSFMKKSISSPVLEGWTLLKSEDDQTINSSRTSPSIATSELVF